MEHIRTPGLEAFEERWRFSHVVVAQGLLLLSGVTGTDVDGSVSSDPSERLTKRSCTCAGTSSRPEPRSRTCSLTSYHVDLRQHLDAFMAVKDRHILAPYPAWSAIGVSQLITAGVFVEIRAIAADPRTRRNA